MSEVDRLTPAADRSARVLSLLLPVAAALAAITFLIFSAASFERIKAYMDALSFDGDAETFSRPLFATLVRTARITAAALACAAAVLVQSRRRIELLLAGFAAHTFGYVRRTTHAAGEAIRTETAVHTMVCTFVVVTMLLVRL